MLEDCKADYGTHESIREIQAFTRKSFTLLSRRTNAYTRAAKNSYISIAFLRSSESHRFLTAQLSWGMSVAMQLPDWLEWLDSSEYSMLR